MNSYVTNPESATNQKSCILNYNQLLNYLDNSCDPSPESMRNASDSFLNCMTCVKNTKKEKSITTSKTLKPKNLWKYRNESVVLNANDCASGNAPIDLESGLIICRK